MARRKNVKRIDPRYFLNETVNRNDDGSRLEEAEGPKQALSRWAQMFPDAASALETAGATLNDILQSLGKDMYDPEMGVDTRDGTRSDPSPSTDQTSQGRPAGFPHKFEE
jgi:hypothetical protein